MSLALGPDAEAFRAEVREFLADHQGVEGFMKQGHVWPRVREMLAAMGERGWLSLVWPVEDGGLGKGLVEEFVLWDECGHARAARPPLASGIVAKTLIRHGTPEQKAAWLPPIRSGEAHFSLAYSEPEAGSDLASLRTRAERRGDVYVVDGQKCWQSYAQDMDLLWTLVRTGPQEARARGLSLLMIDKRSPGVTVRPLPTMDGDQLNEIFLEGVEVPVANRVGPEDGAWPIMAGALADERHIQFPPGRIRRDLEEVVAFARRIGASDDPAVRERLAGLAVEVLEVEVQALAVLDAMLRGEPGVVEAAANKIVHAAASQTIARAAFELGGAEALVDADLGLLWCVSMYETIGGGTNEIMRGIVAKAALGLDARG